MSSRTATPETTSELTLLDAITRRMRACRAAPDGVEAPSAILWTDPDRQWVPLMEVLRTRLPELLVLGEFDPDAYTTGRGTLRIRAKAKVEQMKGNRQALVIIELPYQVNKATLLETIARLVQEKRLEGISDLRDESDKDGMRIVIELKRDAGDQIVLNQLYKHTQMETTFGIIFLSIVDGRPRFDDGGFGDHASGTRPGAYWLRRWRGGRVGQAQRKTHSNAQGHSAADNAHQ